MGERPEATGPKRAGRQDLGFKDLTPLQRVERKADSGRIGFKYLAPLLLFLLLLALFAVGLKLNPREVPSPLIGKPAPPFRLSTLEPPGRVVTQEIFRGKISLLNVWASWCTACLEEHPFLLHLAEEGRIQLVGLNYKDQRARALAWLERLGNPYRIVLYDPEGRVALDYGVYGVPETFLIDPSGTIRYKRIGPLTEEVWRREIVPLLEKLAARPLRKRQAETATPQGERSNPPELDEKGSSFP